MLGSSLDDTTRTLYIPLQFWFCRSPACGLPVTALTYDDVTISITFAKKKEYMPVIKSAKLFADYTYIHKSDAKPYLSENQTHLITQVQDSSEETRVYNTHTKLRFRHPVKQILFGLQSQGGWYTALSPLRSARIVINNKAQPRRPAEVYRYLEPYSRNLRCPRQDMYTYSFALSPGLLQPSGSLNFSRITNSRLDTYRDSPYQTTLHVYGISYNVLVIKASQAQLKYA